MDTVVAGKPASQGVGDQALPGILMIPPPTPPPRHLGQEDLQNPGQCQFCPADGGPEPQLHALEFTK